MASRFPEHWGPPPRQQTRDLRQLPANFGRGSSTLVSWVKAKMKEDEEQGREKAQGTQTGPIPSLTLPSAEAEITPSAQANVATAMAIKDAGPWPDLVGRVGEEAIAELRKQFPSFSYALIPPGRMVTMDHRMDRVRVFVDEEGKVKEVPRRG
ncbi:hypothetical protein TeGR_g3166 [Tetraparma gracilis]|uniref:Subtilisin inhibitor 1 n=1 Tax=Tetraparma gracilis TaxID=2962635 RepID=A0ABQ6MQ78_9STRA|nr:hypothetical protein TeGR_g3166 [Tetraparma gracilis]